MSTPSNYFIFNMACADVLLTVYAVPVSIVDTAYSHQWLITGVAGELLCRLSQFIGQMSVLVSTGSLLVTALDRFFLVFYPLKRIITLRITRFLIGVIWIFAIVFTVPLFKTTTLVEFKPDLRVCTFNFQIIGYVIIYLLFCYPVVVLLPIIAIILIYDWIQTETHHSTRQPTPVKSTSTGTDEPQDISNACHCCCCANRLSFSVDFWNDGLFLWLKNCLLLELSVPWLVSGML